MPGQLILIPTPIGNLGDMTQRGLEYLRTVDGIYAEDTRIARRLLQHFGIENQLFSFHLANEHKVVEQAADRIASGETWGIITDSGTPGISDPGYLLVRACIERGVTVVPLPGANAFVPALIASGLPCDRFYFEGFLPHKKGRQTRLDWVLEMPCTTVLYESPYRVVKLLKELQERVPDRPMCLAREITKKFEEFIRGSVREVLVEMEKRPAIKGEFVVVLGGKE